MTLAAQSMINIDPSQMVFSPKELGIVMETIAASPSSAPEALKIIEMGQTLESNIALAAAKSSGIKASDIAYNGGSQTISAPKPENSIGSSINV